LCTLNPVPLVTSILKIVQAMFGLSVDPLSKLEIFSYPVRWPVCWVRS
jgi:hypothetical protein